jgi:hypothetical protein
MQIKPLFKKGETAFTITNLEGVFKVLKVKIIGLVYQDFEEGKEPVYFYVFNLPPMELSKQEGAKVGQKIFGKQEDVFKTEDEAIAAIQKVLAVNVENFDKNISALEKQIALFKEAKEKLIASAQDLTLSKLV